MENRQWTDAALAAAAIWQGTDDALARTTSPLATVAGRARRLGPAGRLLGAVLERLVRLAALLPTSLAAQRDVGRWRDDVLEIALETAALAADPTADEAGPGAGRAAQLVHALGTAPPGIAAAVPRIPSSFRAFDQHPADVAALVGRVATRWPDRSRAVLVVGVRTSGSHLAPFTVAALRQAGYADVTAVSARPDQGFPDTDVRRVRTAARRGALALVVDDPPDSGNAVAAVCRELVHAGFSSHSVAPVLALFDEAQEAPAALSEFASVTLPWSQWSIHERLAPEQVARDLTVALAPATVEVSGELPAPASLPRGHTRRLYRVAVTHACGDVEERTVLASGAGLGHYGRHDVVVACALKDRVPAVMAAADGVLHLDWPADAGPVRPSPDEVVDYVSARHESLAVTRDRSAALRGSQPVWEVASNHLARAYGRYWAAARIAVVDRLTRRLLQTAAPSVPDGDMRPATWLGGADGEQPVKTAATDRAFSNLDLVCFDEAYDVVGAAVHTGDPAYAAELRAAYATHTDRPVAPERWLAYELVHLWDLQRLGGAPPETVRVRKSQALRRYLAEVLLGDVEAGDEGPLVVLDVDGVVETDLLGFEAPTPASVLALRALHAHGFRTVLATGRSLDDVMDISEVFGLAGGAAEYGSVLYDRAAGSVMPLVTDDELAALRSLRERLEAQPAVAVDRRHRWSVRASAVDGGGRRGPLEPTSVIPAGVRAVRGEGQTDLVAARLDKVDGVQALSRQLRAGTPVLAVGDTATDAPLLEWAPYSVVPSHADATARAAAIRVARRPYQAGLADAVGGLVGHRPGGCAFCAPPEATAETRDVLRLLGVSEGSRLAGLARSVPLLWAGGRTAKWTAAR